MAILEIPEPEDFEDFNEIEELFEFNSEDFGDEFSLTENFETRYIKPLKSAPKREKYLKYKNAEDLANIIDVNDRTFVILNGTFIFGDFVEALVKRNDFKIKDMVVSSLSVSENNIDSFANIIDRMDSLSIIVSDYFYSHERKNLIPYAYQELDNNNKFQLAAATSHCKICLFETYCGKFVVIHGSANLRSSHSIEHITIENNKELHDFTKEYQMAILDKFKTIDKKYIGKKELWNLIK